MRLVWMLALLAVVAGCTEERPSAKEETAALLARADEQCPGGTVKGCVEAAAEAAKKGDAARHAELQARVCDAGLGGACTVLGGLYWQGRGVEASPTMAYTFYMKGCEAEDAPGCFNAAICHRSGACAEKSDAKATELLQRACKGGDKRACANLPR